MLQLAFLPVRLAQLLGTSIGGSMGVTYAQGRTLPRRATQATEPLRRCRRLLPHQLCAPCGPCSRAPAHLKIWEKRIE